jgi:hypothetical protein
MDVDTPERANSPKPMDIDEQEEPKRQQQKKSLAAKRRALEDTKASQ